MPNVPQTSPDDEVNRKAILVALGAWAVTTGRRWLVRAIQHMLTREGLRHA
jgi:hypothetical protein